MSSQPPFRGGRGGTKFRGRGGGKPQYRNNFRDDRSDRHLSPDRRSVHSGEDHFRPPRFNNYRQPPRPDSRSPSPPNRLQNRNGPPDFPDRCNSMNDRRHRSPDHRPIRNEDRRLEGNASRNPADDTIDVRAVIEDRHPTLKLTGKEKAREWKLRLADAEEEVRRAEYALRRAKMDHEAIKEAYQEYTETTIVRSKH